MNGKHNSARFSVCCIFAHSAVELRVILRPAHELGDFLQTKVLTVIALVQTVILLFLIGKTVANEDELHSTELARHSAPAGDRSYDPPTPAYASQSQHDLNATQVRTILQEELRAYFGAASEPAVQQHSAIASNSIDDAEFQYQRELVAQQLLYHTSVGSISTADMQILQGGIAKLDAASSSRCSG